MNCLTMKKFNANLLNFLKDFKMYMLSTKIFELKKKIAEFILPIGHIFIYWVDTPSTDGVTFATAEQALKRLESVKKFVDRNYKSER